jgi:hypothetical protein
MGRARRGNPFVENTVRMTEPREQTPDPDELPGRPPVRPLTAADFAPPPRPSTYFIIKE